MSGFLEKINFSVEPPGGDQKRASKRDKNIADDPSTRIFREEVERQKSVFFGTKRRNKKT